MRPSAGAGGRGKLGRWTAIVVGGLVTGMATGALAWRLAAADEKVPPPRLGADEARLLGKADEAKTRKQREAGKLRQADLGSGYQIDAEGNLIGPNEMGDLPSNKSLAEVGAAGGEQARASIAGAIHTTSAQEGAAAPSSLDPEGGHEDGEQLQRAELEKSMLGYSTVKAAKWATRRPESAGEVDGAGPEARRGSREDVAAQAIGMAERRLAGLKDAPAAWSGTGAGPSTALGPGPSKGGNDLMPAEERAQPFVAGTVGDMRIGGGLGPEQVVRQGKFLDCVLVNEVRADLVESPAIGMVSRDFVSLDGANVLVPAGAKLIGTAGRVQNLQQSRVYLRFDRIIFPDQRSAYFPVRKLPAVAGGGAVGVEGDVDRHFMLTFGSAVMLGLLDGLAAAVEGAHSSATPSTRELIAARSSMNMSQVVAGILARYGNVVPTVTVAPGSPMKVFFAEDVRMSPYMTVRELSWVRRGGER